MPVGWKQAVDSKFRKVFFLHILFVDNKTVQKLDGNLINVVVLFQLWYTIAAHMIYFDC